MRPFALSASLLLLAAACSSDPLDPGTMMPDGENPIDDPTLTHELTFHRDIEPLLQQRCQNCHRPEGVGPFSMLTYDDTAQWAGLIKEATESKIMPPWGAHDTEDCKPRLPWAEDERLTDEQIDMIARWVDDGAPEGDVADAPAPMEFQTFGLEGIRAEMLPQAEFVTQGARDQFICFVLDPGWDKDVFVNGANFIAGNTEVVHHAIAFTDPNRESLDKVNEQGWYECFGTPGVSNTSLVHAWAPGAGPMELGDVGIQVAAGTLIVLQIHYHPEVDTPEADRSTLQLKWLDDEPAQVANLALIGNFDEPVDDQGVGLLPGPEDQTVEPVFRIPAGSEAHVENMEFTLPERIGDFPIPELRIVATGTHMHYVGKSMRIEIERAAPLEGEPAKECLIETPYWDFNWQRAYYYDVPIEEAPRFEPGDILHMRCEYDNSLKNKFVVEALREQGLTAPKDVFLGDETLDEMCLGVFLVVFDNPFIN